MFKKVFPFFSILILVTVAFLPACHRGERGKEDPSTIVVAEVNGREIFGNIFLKEYDAFKKRVKISDSNDEMLERQMREGVMDNIIRNVLIGQEAEKAGITITREMEDEAIQSLLKGFSSDRLQTILRKQNRTYEEWKDSVRRNLLAEKLISTKISQLVQVPDEDVKRYYDEHSNEFNKPAQAHVFHILCGSSAEAEKARTAIAEGSPFDATARKVSKSPEGGQGGDLGMVSEGQMPKELDDVIFKLKENEISKVIESPYGFHLVKVTEFAKPRLMAFQEAKGQIYNRMFHEQLEKKFEEWLQEIKKNAKIKVYTERLYRL